MPSTAGWDGCALSSAGCNGCVQWVALWAVGLLTSSWRVGHLARSDPPEARGPAPWVTPLLRLGGGEEKGQEQFGANDSLMTRSPSPEPTTFLQAAAGSSRSAGPRAAAT